MKFAHLIEINDPLNPLIEPLTVKLLVTQVACTSVTSAAGIEPVLSLVTWQI